MDFRFIKKDYYCLIAGLPDINIDGNKLGETSQKFKSELGDKLSASDFKLVKLLYLNHDNENLLNLLLKKDNPFISLGNYSKEYLEEQIKEPSSIVEYLKRIIYEFKAETFENSELDIENKLHSSYYQHVLNVKNNFFSQWFTFEKDMKNIISAVNARKYGYDLEKQLIPVKNQNELYKSLLISSPKQDSITDKVPFAKQILQIAESDMDISAKEKAFDNIKWEFLDELTVFNYFTVEIIASFIIKLKIVERWIELDNETGKELFTKLIESVKMTDNVSEDAAAN